MKKETKKFIRNLIIFDVIAVIVILGIGVAAIIPDCSYDCGDKGEMLGGALFQFILFSNILIAIIRWMRNRKK